MSGAFESGERRCEWPGCEAKAAYRAPVSPDQLDCFRWFCLDHVRAYNATWNFFEEWSAEELEQQARADRVWDRPTWGLGQGPSANAAVHGHAEGKAWERFGFSDPLEVLGENATMNPGRARGARPEEEREKPRRRLTREEQRAMDTLGLPHQVESRKELRTRYTELVKELHPDMNGGHNPEPDRLGRVLKAWRVLRRSRNFTD
ncbi:MAG: J domain-containing protein [Pseudomonadota bacterium]